MTDVLCMAAWFGLVTGIVEGAGFLALQQLGWLNWNRVHVPVAIEILWIAPCLDVLLFGGLGVALAVVARLWPRLPIARCAFPLFAFMAFYDWAALSGHLYHYAVLALALGGSVALSRWFQRHEVTTVRFLRRTVPALAGLTLLAFGGITAGQWLQERVSTAQLPPARAGAPNVLMIVVDTLRADHLSAYGYGRATSPNLERLAQQGALFENAISTSSWTLPSHASLVTGRYTYEHQAEKRPLDARFPTIAEALQARGYRTGAFSGNVYYFNRWHGFGRGFLHFEDYFQTFGDAVMRTLYGREARKYLVPHLGIEDVIGRRRAPDINRALLAWLDHAREKPFFAFLNYLDTHDPYVPPRPYRTAFSKAASPGGILNQDVGADFPQLTPDQLQGEIDAYDGAIVYTDFNIGQLLAELQRRGLLDNTVVIVTGDHGESFGEHGLFLHQSALYWELIHVPLIIVRPGVVPGGMRIVQPVSNATLPATILTLVGADGQTVFPQASLTRFWGAASSSDWPFPIAELAQVPWGPKQRPSYYGAMKSVVSPKWQYIVHEKLGVELYDWRRDPGELNNLAQHADLQDVVHQFGSDLSVLAAHEQGPRPQPNAAPTPGPAAAAGPASS